MQTEAAKALAEMSGLASVAEIRSLAAKGTRAALKVNAHLHLPPNFSAFATVAQMVDLAAAQGVAVVGPNNYYDYEVYGEFARLARAKSIFPLFGLEIICLVEELQSQGVKINDPANPGKFDLCGKGITRFVDMTPDAARILGDIRRNDSTRMANVVQRLATVFEQRGLPTGLTEAAVIDRIVKRHGCPRHTVYLQERHVCQVFQERFFELVPEPARIEKLTHILGAAPKAGPNDAVKIQNEIRAHLLKAGKPGYVAETFIGFAEARKLIVELGGIPCYPTLADGTSPICGFEDPVASLIERIQERNIGCAEFIPVRNSPAVLSKYAIAMRAAGLIVTAGTEHNTLELIPIEPACLGGQPVPADVQAIFWEGACVVAAHQFLSLHGQPGYVPGATESRIAELHRIGAAVIYQYREASTRAN